MFGEQFRASVDRLRRRRRFKSTEISVKATGRRNFVSELHRGNLPVVELTGHLYETHAVRDFELYSPEVRWRGDSGATPPVLNVHDLRPQVDDVHTWMATLSEVPRADPMMRFMIVLRVEGKAISTVGVGILALLAIEGQIYTPESMDELIQRSPEEFTQIAVAAAAMKPGDPSIQREKRQTLYLPTAQGGRIVSCLVNTAAVRLGDQLITYAQASARWTRSASGHPLEGQEWSSLVKTKDL